MSSKIIAQGAEAKLIQDGSFLIKGKSKREKRNSYNKNKSKALINVKHRR